jgi:putative endonuclease
MAERSNAAVLKTVEAKASGGSNPSLSAERFDLDRTFTMFYSYILKSTKDQGYYFGHCSDLNIRLQKHNSGKVRSTKARIPFAIHYSETFQTKSEAYNRVGSEGLFPSLSSHTTVRTGLVHGGLLE